MEYKGINQTRIGWETKEHCEKLFVELNCGFIGLALQNSDGPDVRWHYAIGNSNQKYTRITVRYGKGIAGKVISTGRPLIVGDFPTNIHGKALEYPIMLAENLRNAFAVPIHDHGTPKGVLLVGNRTNQTFSESKQMIVLKAVKQIEENLNGQQGEMKWPGIMTQIRAT